MDPLDQAYVAAERLFKPHSSDEEDFLSARMTGYALIAIAEELKKLNDNFSSNHKGIIADDGSDEPLP